MQEYNVHHRGRFRQIPIYLGKFFRMFIFQNDWKVLPMSAVIALLVAYVAGSYLFVNMEGTVMGSMALTCVCLWNGCFNSIQSVCREREIVKREHRAGMHIFAYISAHMIYQAFLCLAQTLITVLVCRAAGLFFPEAGLITPAFTLDIIITLFLTTFAADMMSLMISCIVRTTTDAMTVMPLVLIFQLVFSGILFSLSGTAEKFSYFTVAKWGMRSLCSLGDYNSLPMVSVWNQLCKFQNVEVMGAKPIYELVRAMADKGMHTEFMQKTGAYQSVAEYAHTAGNLGFCWMHLLAFALLFAVLAMTALKFVDRDRR